MSRPFDPRLYLVTDRTFLGGRELVDLVEAAVRGGVTLVQLREKTLDTRTFIKEAQRLKNILSSCRVPLLINDRVDVALAAGADGVHIGQSDMPLDDARRLMGPDAIIGLSLESVQDAENIRGAPVDYVAASPVFATPTKTDTAQPLGLEGVRAMRRLVTLPLVAIGGIHAGNLKTVMDAGADGVAVVSAILGAEDPEQAARALRDRMQR